MLTTGVHRKQCLERGYAKDFPSDRVESSAPHIQVCDRVLRKRHQRAELGGLWKNMKLKTLLLWRFQPLPLAAQLLHSGILTEWRSMTNNDYA